MREENHGAIEEPDTFAGPSGVLQGEMTLRFPLPGGVTLELPAVIDMSAGVNPLAADCSCLEANGTVEAPLALRLPVLEGQGEVDLNLALTSNASLQMALPGRHGLVQANGLAAGPLGLRLSLPDKSGTLTANGSIHTPFTLAMVVPDGRAKLSLQGSVNAQVGLNTALPDGGTIDLAAELDCRVQGIGFLPSGSINLKASTPIHTTIHLKALPIPQTERALSLDIGVEGTADLEMPENHARLRLQFAASLPLKPLVALIRDEVERQVRIEQMILQPPRLLGAHDLELVLYVEARKGILAKVEVTAQLRIEPRSKQIVLRSIQARGYNPAGSVVGRFFLNRKLFRPLRHTRLFDPSTMLPAEAHVDDLRFQSATSDALVIAGDLTFSALESSGASGTRIPQV